MSLVVPHVVSAADSVRSFRGALKLDSVTPAEMQALVIKRKADGRITPLVTAKESALDVAGKSKAMSKVVDRMPAGSRVFSFSDRKRNVIGVLVAWGYEEKADGWTKADFYVLDSAGRRTFQVKDVSVRTVFHPSPSGDYAVGWSGYSAMRRKPTLYLPGGRTVSVKEGDAPGEWPTGHEAQIIRFAPDGSRYAIVAARSGDQKVIVYRRDGSELWRANWGGEISFAEGADLTAIYHGAGAAIYDGAGRQVASPVFPGMTSAFHGEFSAGGSHFALVTNDGEVALFKAPDWKPLWVKRLADLTSAGEPTEGERRVIHGLAVSDAANLIVVSGVRYEMRPNQYGMKKAVPVENFLTALSRTGELVDSLAFAPKEPLFDDRNHWIVHVGEQPVQIVAPTTGGVFRFGSR